MNKKNIILKNITENNIILKWTYYINRLYIHLLFVIYLKKLINLIYIYIYNINLSYVKIVIIIKYE